MLRRCLPFFLALGLASPIHAAQGIAAHFFVYRMAPDGTAKFEEGYKKHLQWHRAHGDPLSWYGWTIEDGERDGYFVDASLGEPFAAFDRRVDVAADGADFRANVAPYATPMGRPSYVLLRELSTGTPLEERKPSKTMQVTFFEVRPGMESRFEHAVAAVRRALAARPAAPAHTWYRLVTGGAATQYLLLVARDDWAGYDSFVETDPHGSAAPDAPAQGDPRCGTWSHVPETFDPCAVPAAGTSLELGDGVWTLDTNSGSLTDPDDNATFPASALITAQGGIEARAVSVERFSLTAAATLYVRGKRPLIIVSWTDADVHGVIDATSRAGMPGAGSNPDACTPTGAGADNIDGAGGGGGGGFGTAGAAGGSGDDGMASAGSAGAATPSATLRGGCAGGAGGNALHGAGGDGGGAVVVAARELITLSGSITAGGGGGGAAQGGHSGGGGGGGGGYIGLASASVVIGPGAIVAANGGAGGGGSDGSPASVGQDGQPTAVAAVPGPGQGMGGGGGAGGARGVPPKPGAASHRGGGGGGGAVGIVRLDTASQDVDSTAVVSPAPLP